MKDLEIRRYPVGCKCHHKCPWKRGSGRDLTRKRKWCDRGGRDCSDAVAKRQGMLAATRNCKRQEDSCPRKHSPSPPDTDCSLMAQISDFWPPQLWENKFLWFSAIKLWWFVTTDIANEYKTDVFKFFNTYIL